MGVSRPFLGDLSSQIICYISTVLKLSQLLPTTKKCRLLLASTNMQMRASYYINSWLLTRVGCIVQSGVKSRLSEAELRCYDGLIAADGSFM